LLSARVWALNVAPTYQVFDAKPGEKIRGEFTLTNDEAETVRITPGVKEWFKLTENVSINVGDWLIISSAPLSMKAGEMKKVAFELRAPKTAQGELVGMASFLIETENRESMINKRFSVAVYMSIKGTEKMKAQMNGIALSITTNSVTAAVNVENKGNIHIRPEGLFQILDEKNVPQANVTIKRDQPTYPGDQRTYLGTVTGLNLKPGHYTAKIELQDTDRQIPIINETKKFVIDKKRKVIAK